MLTVLRYTYIFHWYFSVYLPKALLYYNKNKVYIILIKNCNILNIFQLKTDYESSTILFQWNVCGIERESLNRVCIYWQTIFELLRVFRTSTHHILAACGCYEKFNNVWSQIFTFVPSVIGNISPTNEIKQWSLRLVLLEPAVLTSAVH